MNEILPFFQSTLPTRTAETDAVATVSIAAASMATAIAAAMRSEAIKKSVAVVRAVSQSASDRRAQRTGWDSPSCFSARQRCIAVQTRARHTSSFARRRVLPLQRCHGQYDIERVQCRRESVRCVFQKSNRSGFDAEQEFSLTSPTPNALLK